jgi:hypothetical protein
MDWMTLRAFRSHRGFKTPLIAKLRVGVTASTVESYENL